jgi:glutathione S-transferase
MRLLGTLRSPYVRKVRVVAAEVGLLDQITLEVVAVHLAETTPALMAVNPLNKLPTLIDDDGTVVIDSLVICDYLADKAGRADLLPRDMPARLDVLTTHALGDGLLDLCILRLVERAKPPERAWPEVMAATAAKIGATLDHLNTAHGHLAQQGCTVGTVAVAVALGYLDFRFADLDWRSGRRDLADWYAAFSERPALRDNPFVDTTPTLAGMVR